MTGILPHDSCGQFFIVMAYSIRNLRPVRPNPPGEHFGRRTFQLLSNGAQSIHQLPLRRQPGDRIFIAIVSLLKGSDCFSIDQTRLCLPWMARDDCDRDTILSQQGGCQSRDTRT